MTLRRLRRSLVPVLAAFFALAIATSAEAKDVDTIIWATPASPYNDNGRVYFSTNGDHIGIYDDSADGESVCVDFYATPVSTGKRKLYAECNSGGAGTRKDFNFDFVENTDVTIRGWMFDRSNNSDHHFGSWRSTVA
ncbi:hypothetical protein [Streptomyces albidoflavus]|uniref:hypothetical protein n=1 Tax=Streptomyces albidoflavus TaxID=1886 RepID=UPI0011606744|nr:hypothetical protein [Streptomyces albidoflavus]